MADTDPALQEESDTSRAAEWARLDAEDSGGQPDTAPAADPAPEPTDEPSDAGQASSPPADPAAEKPAGSDTAATDIWANADPALKAEWDKAQNLIRTQTGRLQAESRRVVELSGEVTTLRGKAKETEPEAEPGPVLTEEQRATLREEFPDVAGPLLDVLGSLEKRVETLTAAGASQAEQQDAARQLEVQRFLAAEEQTLSEQHSDWREQVAKPEFTTWAQAQPRYIREALVRNGNGIVDASESADILTRFKTETGKAADPVAARREAQLNGGRVPQARTTVATPSTTTDREAEWKRLDALDWQRNGARSQR